MREALSLGPGRVPGRRPPRLMCTQQPCLLSAASIGVADSFYFCQAEGPSSVPWGNRRVTSKPATRWGCGRAYLRRKGLPSTKRPGRSRHNLQASGCQASNCEVLQYLACHISVLASLLAVLLAYYACRDADEQDQASRARLGQAGGNGSVVPTPLNLTPNRSVGTILSGRLLSQ